MYTDGFSHTHNVTDTIRMGLPIVYFKGSQVEFQNFDVFFNFISAKNADPDKMHHYAAIHPGFHCLPKYLSKGFQNTKG